MGLAVEIFEKYLAKIENDGNRARMREVLQWIADRFPDMKAKIAWNQPMFTDHGTFIIGFSASKHHFSVAPEPRGIEEFTEEFRRLGYSYGSNIFRIKWDEPVNYPLLERIIEFNRRDKKDCSTFWRK